MRLGLTLFVLGLMQLAAAFNAPVATTRSLRTSPVIMKHPDFVTRLARSEAGRLRLVVTKSNNHIYGQIVDDTKHAVVVAASTMEKEQREGEASTRDCAAATEVGKRLAAKALAKGVEKVYFDRKGKKVRLFPRHHREITSRSAARFSPRQLA